ncbi:MAG: ABC transporter ATP-binding protein [Planctomycetes bacterium]|nr:ABC transporter ATP-binding protein [Planctomycetota bacterium]
MRPFWHIARRLLKRRGMLVSAMALAFLSAAGLGIGLLSLGPILEQILHPEAGGGLRDLAEQANAAGGFWHVPDGLVQILPEGQFNSVLFLIIAIWCLTIVGATANFLHQYLSQTLTTITIAEIRRDLFDHVLRLPLSHVTGKGSSEYTSRIIRDTAGLEAGLIGLLGKSVAQISKGIAALAVAVIFDWKIVVVACFVAPILGVTLRKIAKRIRRGSQGSLAAQQDLLRLASERIQGLRAVKTSTAESTAGEQFEESNRRVVRNELRMRTAKAMSSPIMETLAIFVLGSLALLAANSILSGSLPFERFLLSVGALAVAGASFRPLANIVNDISAASAPAQRILDVLGEPVEPEAGAALKRHAESLELRDVTYTYPGAPVPAVQGVNLNVEFGEHVAVVGPNGSGKTTLLSLVPRLLHPDSGQILIDGVDITGVSLKDLRSQIAVVTQESFIMHGTIAENIAFGVRHASESDIVAAASASCAASFIDALPDGYNTAIAEHGATLSGGQRQRIAIARALLRNPALLILDEATSQVDSESEAAIAEAIRGVSNCTVLVIAHRLTTVLECSRILVLDAGGVVDCGPHADLLARCGLYERLIKTQLVAVET